MWIFWLGTILLFYILATLQAGFFAHFNFLGAVPNLVFIFFLLVLFFSVKKSGFSLIIFAAAAGFFLDIFSGTNFGVSVILLALIGFLAKKAQGSFLEEEDKYPLSHFLLIFLSALFIYEVLLMLYLRFLDPAHVKILIDFRFLFEIIYNLIVATAGFYIYKKVIGFTKKI
ncbi:MAG: rod shape-determining protein MreD [Candidatus Staskawiczbacteria bacterium]|nr:rod shape-determining protein MreD [Candidatus Staskawiczbacteria bacterium]